MNENPGVIRDIGRRPYQQDHYSIAWLPGFDTLTDTQQKEILEKTFAEMQTACKKFKEQGSTAIVAIICPKKIVVATVGDSLVYLVKHDGNSVSYCKRLNTKLHVPTHPEERAYIESQGGEVKPSGPKDQTLRLNGCLAVSRSVGDTSDDHKHIYKAVRHDPDFYHVPYEICANEKLVLVVASDGLIDKVPVNSDEQYVSKFFSDYGVRMSVQELATLLLKQKKQENFGDNLTVLIQSLDSGDCSKMLAVFDGHSAKHQSGEDEVSSYLKENFAPTLAGKIIELTCQPFELKIIGESFRELEETTDIEDDESSDSHAGASATTTTSSNSKRGTKRKRDETSTSKEEKDEQTKKRRTLQRAGASCLDLSQARQLSNFFQPNLSAITTTTTVSTTAPAKTTPKLSPTEE